MKKFFYLIMILAVSAAVSCSSVKKYTGNISAGDVSRIADLVDMSFGSGPNGPFEVSKTMTKDSTLIIQNDTDRTITVKASGATKKTFVVKAGKSDKAVVKPGQYHFTATAPKTKGCDGDVKLEGFNEYKWIFIIRN
jgi:hypothetical protein